MNAKNTPRVLPLRFLVVAALLLALLAGGWWFGRAAQPVSMAARWLVQAAHDRSQGMPGIDAEHLIPRPTVEPELRAVLNFTRGRPPVILGDVPDMRGDWFWDQRTYPLDGAEGDADLKALRHVEQAGMIEAQSPEQSWQALGPNTIDNGLIGLHNCTQFDCGTWRTNVSGRSKVIAFHPQNPNIIYIATAVGGIWKSTNGGASYVPLTDSQPTHAFHSLVLDPQNPDIVYAGSGELQGYYGIGILKSTNGGQTWTVLGENVFRGLVVTAIAINPNNTNIVYAASSVQTHQDGPTFPPRGVFRSTNGGQSWTALASCEQCYGVSDLVMDSNNPQILYAGVHGQAVLKTTDGGATWSALTNGFPDRGFDRVELAIGRGNQSNVLYAGLDARVNQGGRLAPWGLIYKTTNGGQSWQLLANAPNYCSSQCGYDNIIEVHPSNANIIYIGGNLIGGDPWRGVVHKTTDGGQSWQDVTPGNALNRMVHPDMHGITFHPNNPEHVWVANDGGIFRTTNGGQTWQHANANLATLQFIGIGLHPTNPNIVIGGLQDNAKARYDGNGWTGLDTGDGGYSKIDPFNTSIWYSTRFSIQGSVVQFQRNDKGGTAPLADWQQKANGIDFNDRVLFYVPFTLDPSSPGVLYLGTHRLYRTANRGDNWQVISGDLTKGETTRGRISTIAVAPNDPNTIYTGSSDGFIGVTRNRGSSWQNVTTNNIPNRHISQIIVSPTSAATAYAVINGYNTHTPGSPGHVFKTTNAGASWQNITSNLPDIPTLSIALDPRNPGHLYIGTDIGVFRSTNDGGSWAFFNQGLATVPVVGLELNDVTRHLWAATGGRGVFRLNLGAGAGPTPTPTPTPTRTPTTAPRTRTLYVPLIVRNLTTLPPTGPAPGNWSGEKASFAVTSDQADVWNIRVRVPVPGCDIWVTNPAFARISGNNFTFEVDLRENGFWSNQGSFASSTQASGRATFRDVYFGTSCGSWSGTVDWTAQWQGGAVDPTATPTSTPRPATPTPSSTAGIHGQVTHRGIGVGGLNLWLRRCANNEACNFEASKVANTVTDANGYYQFTGVPSLPAGHFYFVYYFNHPDAGNAATDAYLWRWYGPDITSYTAGASVSGGVFELEDIILTGPATEQSPLPVTFTWNPGGRGAETYSWELFDLQTGASLCFSNPSANTSFQLTAATFANVCNGAYGVEYGWFVWAVKGASWENNQGFGDSYYYAGITFTAPNGATATPTPTRTPTPPAVTATPTATSPAPSPRIDGRVTNRGAGVGGVTLQLLACTPNCAVVGTTNTDANGYYAFINLTPPGPGQAYRVRYVNGPNGGNALNQNYLAYWVTHAITALAAQAQAVNVSFDIADVALQGPPHQFAGSLPINFSWQSRAVAGDYFAWAMSFGGTEICAVNPPVTSTGFTLDLSGATACNLFTLTPYNWYVYVTKGATFNNGFGLSYFFRTFTITGAQGAMDRRLPGALPEALPGFRAEELGLPEGLIPTIDR